MDLRLIRMSNIYESFLRDVDAVKHNYLSALAQAKAYVSMEGSVM
jgi:hypothetical protein